MLSHFALLSAVVLIVLLAREASGYVFTRTARFISFENKNRLRAVADVTSATAFDKIVKESKSLVVIDYSTTWCGPCKMVLPKYVELSEKYPKVVFLKCIGDETPDAGALMKREGVRSVPCFHFWKDGQRVEVINGARIDEVETLVKASS